MVSPKIRKHPQVEDTVVLGAVDESSGLATESIESTPVLEMVFTNLETTRSLGPNTYSMFSHNTAKQTGDVKEPEAYHHYSPASVA